MYPIVMLVGQAGSGKDAVADALVDIHIGLKLSLAKPLKEFARAVFNFSDEQLWGPSSARNAPDPRWVGPAKRKVNLWQEPARLAPASPSYVGYHERCAFNFMFHGRQWADLYTSSASESLSDWYNCHIAPQTELTPRHVLQTLGTEWGRTQYENIWIDAALRDAEAILEAPKLHRNNLVVIPDGRFRNEALAVLKKGGKLIRIVNPEGPTISTNHQSETESQTIPDFWFHKVYVNHKTGLEALKLDVMNWSLQ